jgi:hypothetical protein
MIRLKALLQETKKMVPNALGDTWRACINWKQSGGTNYWNGKDGRPDITVDVSDSSIYVAYIGKTYGFSIATPGSELDSLHQIFNILICEGNAYLQARPGLKPVLQNIRHECDPINVMNVSSGDDINEYAVRLTIEIPFIQDDNSITYQFNRRGGWTHDPGPSAVIAASKETAYEIVGEPVTVYIKTNFNSTSSEVTDGITEHFLLLKKYN